MSTDLEREGSQRHTRRGFLDGALGIGFGLSTTSFAHTLNLAGTKKPEGAAAILNLAATAEMLAVTFYYSAVTQARFQIGSIARDHIRRMMNAEMQHLETLQSLGGTGLRRQFYFPRNVASDARVFVQAGLDIETVSAAGYIAATHELAAFGQPALAAIAAQLAAGEAQHYTAICHLANLAPRDLVLPARSSFGVADTQPALAPYLSGSDTFAGPVDFPTTRQLASALASARRGFESDN